MERRALIFATILIFIISVLSRSETACETTESDALPSPSYPILREACIYRQRKQMLRNGFEEEIRTKLDEDHKWRQDFTDQLEDRVKNDQKEMTDACWEEAAKIGGEDEDQYSNWCDIFNFQISSIKIQPLLVIDKYKYPHMAVLGWSQTNNTISWNCGASLIHKDFVLTAAHCIFNTGKPPDLVRISDRNLLRGGGDEFAIDYDIEKILTHEQYNSVEYYNDIALLKIKRRPEFDEKRPPLPACIWTKKDYPTINYTALGYGAPFFGQEYVLVLKINNLTLFNSAECTKFFEGVDELPRGILENQLCASDPAGISDTCEGDSGGPLQFHLLDEFETPILIGITSFGKQCIGGNPGGYTKIYGFLDWIERKLRENM